MPSPSEPARSGPRRLTHVNLFVGDLARSEQFYEQVCGISVVFDEPGIKAKFLSNGNSHHDLALMQSTNEALVGRDGEVQKSATRGARPGLNHLGFEMHSEADLVRAIRRIEDAGVRISRMLDHQISHSVYFADPDGVDIELYADTTPDWRGIYSAAEGQLLSARWQPPSEGDADPHYVEDFELVAPEGAVVAPRRTERAAVVVSDLDASIAFYESVVGLSTVDVDAVSRRAVLGGSAGGAHLLLVEAQAGEPTGFRGFGLRVDDPKALDDARAELASALVSDEPALARDDEMALVLLDPDGVRVELFAHVAESITA